MRRAQQYCNGHGGIDQGAAVRNRDEERHRVRRRTPAEPAAWWTRDADASFRPIELGHKAAAFGDHQARPRPVGLPFPVYRRQQSPAGLERRHDLGRHSEWFACPGFLEVRAPRYLVTKLPKLRSSAHSPRAKAAVISSNTVETTTALSWFVTPGKSAAAFVISPNLVIEQDRRRRSWGAYPRDPSGLAVGAGACDAITYVDMPRLMYAPASSTESVLRIKRKS